jgi:hypothetical protein
LLPKYNAFVIFPDLPVFRDVLLTSVQPRTDP